MVTGTHPPLTSVLARTVDWGHYYTRQPLTDDKIMVAENHSVRYDNEGPLGSPALIRGIRGCGTMNSKKTNHALSKIINAQLHVTGKAKRHAGREMQLKATSTVSGPYVQQKILIFLTSDW